MDPAARPRISSEPRESAADLVEQMGATAHDLERGEVAHVCHEHGGATGAPAASPVTLADIPDSVFKTRLLKLPAAARERALDRLSRFGFNPDDVGSLRVAPSGDLYYVCSFTASSKQAAERAAAAPRAEAIEVAGADVPVSSPPIRHSDPYSRNILFLDFNGHVVTRTLWNTDDAYGPTTSWDCLPWSDDEDRTTFNASEQAQIIAIWERVAEDYAPFDVDVTTEQPSSWNRNVAHALFTRTTDRNGVRCPHHGYGGIAYVGVFGELGYSYDSLVARSPVWVKETFYANMAEAASHELGHNFGLRHDGDRFGSSAARVEYYDGHNNGGIEWGPIMGSSYGRDVTQWSKGEYFGSNQAQDDLSIIAGRVGYRMDDHGDTAAAATPMTSEGSGALSESGVIENSGDPDVFSFVTDAGPIAISATAYRGELTYSRGANLDIKLRLYNAASELVAENNPAQSLDAAITTNVSAGTYYVHVVPTGMGSPLTTNPTGYTSYGSLGQYSLSAAVPGDADDDGMQNHWELEYFGGYTNASPTGDLDGDGANNLTEFIAGTAPNDSNSVFKVTDFQPPLTTNDPFIIHWSTLPGRVYSVSVNESLGLGDFGPMAGAVDLPSSVNSYTDTVDRASDEVFYRVEVKKLP